MGTHVMRAQVKLREIAASDLAIGAKFLYAAHLVAGWWRRMDRRRTHCYRLRGSGAIELREGTTDRKVFEEIFLSRVYAPFLAPILAPGRSDGAAPCVLIDLGANTGLSAVYLARVLSADWIVAVEPDPSNYAMLVRNLRAARMAERSEAAQAFAGAERGFARLEDSGKGAWGMRMGAPTSVGIPVLPLAEIAALTPVPSSPTPRVILKCDIEGAERLLFERIRDWEHLTSFIMLELHTEIFPEEEFRACVESSGYHWKLHGTISRNSVLAVIGLERLARKTAARGAAHG